MRKIFDDVNIDGDVTADSFIKDGGTSSQYLMADGTVSSGGSGNTTIGTDTDLTTSGATVVDDINLTDGVVTAHSTRTLTLANLGYTGATDANNYVLPFTDNSSNWNTAFGWGDHSTEGYLTSSSTQSKYLRSDAADTATGLLTLNGGIDVLSGTGGGKLRVRRNSNSTDGDDIMDIHMDDGGSYFDIDNDGDSDAGNFAFRYKTGGSFSNLIYFSPTSINYKSHVIWHAGNDGSGSGLDADKLDAQQGSYYLDYNNFTNTPTIPSAYTHPTHNGDDISVDTGALTGAVVISDLDFNVTTDTLGHVTDANAAISTRTLTLADLGFTGDTDATNDQDLSGYLLKSGGTMTGDLQISNNELKFDESGVRSWGVEVGSGNLNISSGDSAGNLNINTNATFEGNVTADSFIKDGGTSSQFLKADGSVDSNTYLTSFTETNSFLGDGGSLLTAPSTNQLIYTGQISNGTSGLFSATNNANSVITLNRHTGNYDSQLGFSSNGNIYYRNFVNNAINTSEAWLQVYHSGNFTNNATNWDTAFGWGDHSTEGYISSVTGDWTGTFDGQEGSYYLDYNNFTNTPTIPTARTDEEIRDVAAAQWVNGANTTVVYDDTANTIKINAPAGGVVDGSGVQNYLVKWTDSDTLTDSIMHETNDRVGINVIQTNATFAVSKTGDETMLFEPNVSNGGRNQIGNLDMSNGSYVGMNWNALDHQIQTSGVTKLTIGSTTIETPNTIEADGFIKDGGTSSQYLMADGSVSTGGASGVDGSGTAKQIPKFSDSDTLTDSNIYEASGGEVHINTTTDMPGMLNVYQDTTSPALLLTADDGGSSASPIMYMHRDSSSPADDDVLGRTTYAGNDSAGNNVGYARIDGYIDAALTGSTNSGGIHLQSRFGATMYSNLRTRGNRTLANNAWYFDTEIQAENGIEIYSGSTISLNNDSGTSGEVLVSKGTSTPEWEHRVRSNTSEGGSGSVQVGNIVKITQSDYDLLGSKDADTIYIIVG